MCLRQRTLLLLLNQRVWMHCLSTFHPMLWTPRPSKVFGFKIILDLTCRGDLISFPSVINLVSVKVIQQVISAELLSFQENHILLLLRSFTSFILVLFKLLR